jgi:hypothetical protein
MFSSTVFLLSARLEREKADLETREEVILESAAGNFLEV